MYKGAWIRLTTDLLPETMEVRRQWDDIKCWKKMTVNQKFYIQQNYPSNMKDKLNKIK